MREILFRAKYVNALPGGHLYKAWIYGYLCDNNHINSPFPTEGEFEININTVCQYTGLTDKNGKKIFEKDILEVDGCYKYVVEDFEYGKLRPIEYWNQKLIEVIGNIFDNPDLLPTSSTDSD